MIVSVKSTINSPFNTVVTVVKPSHFHDDGCGCCGGRGVDDDEDGS